MERQLENYNLLIGTPSTMEDLNYILDTVNKKYNNSLWRAFTDVLPASKNHSFQTIVEETGIVVKASVLGSMSKKPLRSIEGGKSYSDSIHKIGHGFQIDQSDMNAIEELNLVNLNMAAEMVKKYAGRAAAIIGGFHATWNDWIFQALSDQQIVLENQGQPVYTIDLRVPAKNKLKAKGSAAWFDTDDSKYNIVKDLRRMDKIADEDYVNMSSDRVFVCSKDLYDKIIEDKGLIDAVKARMPLMNSTLTILTDNEIMAGCRALGIPPIVAIDEKSRIEIDGVPTLDAAKFNKNKISLIPVSKLFNMHNSPSDYMKDRNPATIKTSFEGGLIGAIELFESDPIKVITNMESWTFPSFKNPKNIVTLDTTKFSATGE